MVRDRSGDSIDAGNTSRGRVVRDPLVVVRVDRDPEAGAERKREGGEQGAARIALLDTAAAGDPGVSGLIEVDVIRAAETEREVSCATQDGTGISDELAHIAGWRRARVLVRHATPTHGLALR